MAKVIVNGAPENFACAPETFAGLLAELERRCEARGEVMTGVRCDGVDNPAFRDATFALRPLADLELVEVE